MQPESQQVVLETVSSDEDDEQHEATQLMENESIILSQMDDLGSPSKANGDNGSGFPD